MCQKSNLFPTLFPTFWHYLVGKKVGNKSDAKMTPIKAKLYPRSETTRIRGSAIWTSVTATQQHRAS